MRHIGVHLCLDKVHLAVKNFTQNDYVCSMVICTKKQKYKKTKSIVIKTSDSPIQLYLQTDNNNAITYLHTCYQLLSLSLEPMASKVKGINGQYMI